MIDRVTRIILAVIAGCLVLLCIRTFQAVPVVATGYEMDIRKVDIIRIGGRPISFRDIQGLGGKK